MDFGGVSYFFREHCSEFLICAALAIYAVGLLSLTALGSSIFVVFSYVGTILLVSGVLLKLELFPSTFKSKTGLSVTLLFISALCFTTAMVSPFLDVTVKYSKGPVIVSGLPKIEIGDPYDALYTIPGAYGGFHLHIRHTYAHLFMPMVQAGVILLLISVVILWLSGSF